MNVNYGCGEALGEAVVRQDLFAFLKCHSRCHGYIVG